MQRDEDKAGGLWLWLGVSVKLVSFAGLKAEQIPGDGVALGRPKRFDTNAGQRDTANAMSSFCPSVSRRCCLAG